MIPYKDYARRPHVSVSRNKILAKRIAWQLVSLLGNLFLLVFKIVWLIMALSGRGLRFFGKILGIKIIGLPAYRLLKKLGNAIAQFQGYLEREWGENFRRNFIIYGGLAALFFFTAAGNLKAQNMRPEDIGRNSALYALLGQDSESNFIIEESEPGQAAAPMNKDRGLAEVGVASQSSEPGVPEETGLISQSGDAVRRPEFSGRGEEAPIREGIIAYIVREGDTISEIADEFGVSVNTILWENKLGERDFIKPGQTLTILPVTGVSHEVKRGETLAGLAKKYSAKEEDILEVNKLADAGALVIGAKIIIPDGRPPQEQERETAAPGRAGRLASIRDIFRPVRSVSARLLWPTISRRITQYFRGWRHTGLDIAAPAGQPIYAADDGVVVTSGWNSGGYGLYIIIDHGGLYTLYGHNSKNYVKRGDRVRRGELIGAIGSTGRSTGPHVHFEVRIGGNRLNPLGYL